ncbi:MAG TPA: CBS domain-containing protein [Acidimicrobiia bacterium]|nr:CBS domain-containing protein [Acidimicrobiia bacterium]
MKVAEVMTTAVATVGPDASWKEVAERMLDAGVSGVPVVGEDGHLLGVITEADLISKPAFGDRPHRSLVAMVDLLTGDGRWAGKATALTAAELMTTGAITASPSENLRAAAQRMLDRRVKRLPVLDQGRLVGILSRRDLLRSFHRTDPEIAAEITGRLAMVRYAPEDHDVTASVVDGVVTLEGSVRTEGEVPVVEGLARDVPGVVQVISHVTYREPTRPLRSNAALRDL